LRLAVLLTGRRLAVAKLALAVEFHHDIERVGNHFSGETKRCGCLESQRLSAKAQHVVRLSFSFVHTGRTVYRSSSSALSASISRLSTSRLLLALVIVARLSHDCRMGENTRSQ
jgi:hypothetical protein